MNTFTKITAVTGSVAMALTMGISVAAANPDLSSLADTPCSYDQAMAAVHAENPAAASFLDSSPENQQALRSFLSSSRPERARQLNSFYDNPGADLVAPVFQQMLTRCVNY